MTTTPATTSQQYVYVTDQFTLTRHSAVDWYVSGEQAWIVCQCGTELPDHPSVNVSLTEAGWWAQCPACFDTTSRPATRSYLDEDLGRMVAHASTSCNCADCAE